VQLERRRLSACAQTPSQHHNFCFIAHIQYTLCPGLPGWASTRKIKPIWILMKQETVSGNGIRWDICKSATRSRQTTTPALHHSVFYRPDALPAAQPTVSKHWRQSHITLTISKWLHINWKNKGMSWMYILPIQHSLILLNRINTT